MAGPQVETHPLQPFIPPGAVILMLGSFPPARKRWSMEFYYPNRQNDMWRILGALFLGDASALLDGEGKGFDLAAIQAFLTRQRIALYDTAQRVVRGRGTASDAELDVVEPTDLKGLLRELPECRGIVCTGGLSARLASVQLGCAVPGVGAVVAAVVEGRRLLLGRTPSSSRAYPLRFELKVEGFRRVFDGIVGQVAPW